MIKRPIISSINKLLKNVLNNPIISDIDIDDGIISRLARSSTSGLKAVIISALVVNPSTSITSGLQASIITQQTYTSNLATSSTFGLAASVSGSSTVTSNIATSSTSGLQGSVNSAVVVTSNLATASTSGLAASISSAITLTSNLATSSTSGLSAAISYGEIWVITGHSITDTWTIKAGFGNNGTHDLAAHDGITYTEYLKSGPYASSGWRYTNSATIGPPDLVNTLRTVPNIKYLVGIEAMDDVGGLASAINDYGNPPAAAYSGAMNWHTEATTADVDAHYYVRWPGSSTEYGGFNQSWRNAITQEEWPRWDSIKTYVDANKTGGSPPFEFVYLDAAFAVLFDRIQAGTYTQFAIGDFFTDNVHPATDLGNWLCCAFVWHSIRGTNPASYPLQLGDMSAPITSARRTELVDLIVDVAANPSLAFPTTTITSNLATASTSGLQAVVSQILSTGLSVVNLDGVADWQTPVFLNRFKQARELSGFGGSAVLTADRYPTTLDGNMVWLLMWDRPAADTVLNGRYRFAWSGDGTFVVTGGTNVDTATPGQIEFDFTTTGTGGITITLSAIGGTAPTNFRCVKTSDWAAHAAGQIFESDFLNDFGNASHFRFIDWCKINSSDVVTWSDRTTANSATYQRPAGVPIETQVFLCNSLGVKPWFMLPHLADDTYFTNTATYIRDNLRVDLPFMLEFTNEPWNFAGGFEQSVEMAALAASEWGMGGQQWERTMEWYGVRAYEMFTIFETVFGGTSRFKRFFNGQTGATSMDNLGLLATYAVANAHVSEAPHNKVDVVGVTHYFTATASGNAQAYLDILVDDGQDALFRTLYEDALTYINGDWQTNWNTSIANTATYSKQVWGYEGGTHIVNYGGTTNDSLINNAYNEFHRQPEYAALLQASMNAWTSTRRAGDSYWTAFGAVSKYSQYGSWGIQELLGNSTQPSYVTWNAYNESQALPSVTIRPTAITNLSVSVNNTNITSTFTGGSVTTNLRYSDDAGATWTQVNGVTSPHIESVTPGEYLVQVQAVNSVGGGKWSASQSASVSATIVTNIATSATSGLQGTISSLITSNLATSSTSGLQGTISNTITLTGNLATASTSGLQGVVSSSLTLTSNLATSSTSGLLGTVDNTPTASDPSAIMGANSIIWYDVSAGGLFQDAAQTTPAAAGDVVGFLPDQEGSANFTQSGAARPTYQVSGGIHYIENNLNGEGMGVVALPSTVANSWYMVMAFRLAQEADANQTHDILRLATGIQDWNSSDSLTDNGYINQLIAQSWNSTTTAGKPYPTGWVVIECIWNNSDNSMRMSINGDTDAVGSVSSVIANKTHCHLWPIANNCYYDFAGFAIANTVPSAGQRTDMRAWANGLIT